MNTLLAKSLFSRPVTVDAPKPDEAALAELAQSLRERSRKQLGHSLAICAINAGSCDGCELEIMAMTNAVYDLERFGIRFVGSPMHADVLLVTGPVTHNMRVALERAYAATPDPKWVVAVGDCACTGGMFAASYACVGAVENVVPVDLHLKGCPPQPIALLGGLLALLETVSVR